MEQLRPLLSDSFKEFLFKIKVKQNFKIASDLLAAHDYIQQYNIMVTILERDYQEITDLYTQYINTYVNDSMRALHMRRDSFEISFTPKDKELLYTEEYKWSRKNRQEGKPGRIIKRLLVNKYSEKELEIFVNQLKSDVLLIGEFSISTGQQIIDDYCHENYYDTRGSLGNSCMRFTECADYFEIYRDYAKLLVYKKEGKVLGRALLWEIDGKTYMDRIYVYQDYLEEAFKEYAKDHKWYIRHCQCAVSDYDRLYWYGPEDNYENKRDLKLSIQIEEDYDYYPYLDSFRFMDSDSLTLYANKDAYANRVMTNTDGSYDRFNTAVCDVCGNIEMYFGDDGPEELVYSDYHNGYFCPNCCVYNDYLEDFIRHDVECANVIYEGDETVNIPVYILENKRRDIDDYVDLEKLHFWEDREQFFLINNEWYHISAVYWSDESKQYEINE